MYVGEWGGRINTLQKSFWSKGFPNFFVFEKLTLKITFNAIFQNLVFNLNKKKHCFILRKMNCTDTSRPIQELGKPAPSFLLSA